MSFILVNRLCCWEQLSFPLFLQASWEALFFIALCSSGKMFQKEFRFIRRNIWQSLIGRKDSPRRHESTRIQIGQKNGNQIAPNIQSLLLFFFFSLFEIESTRFNCTWYIQYCWISPVIFFLLLGWIPLFCFCLYRMNVLFCLLYN